MFSMMTLLKVIKYILNKRASPNFYEKKIAISDGALQLSHKQCSLHEVWETKLNSKQHVRLLFLLFVPYDRKSRPKSSLCGSEFSLTIYLILTLAYSKAMILYQHKSRLHNKQCIFNQIHFFFFYFNECCCNAFWG